MRRHIPTVIAVVALFAALGGTGYAASRYLITSIHQIAPSVQHQLRGRVVIGPAGPAGPQGPAGPTGPQGPAGPAGASAASANTVAGNIVYMPQGTYGESIAICPLGHTVLDGAFMGGDESVTSSYRDTRLGHSVWIVYAEALGDSSSVQAVAYCS